MAERITQAELARREGVSKPTVTRWIQQGRISGPGPDGKLDAEQAHRERLLTESPLPKHQASKEAKAREHAANRATDATSAAQSSVSGTTPCNGTADPLRPIQGTQSATSSPANSTPEQSLLDLSLNPEQQDLSIALKRETWRLQKAKAEQANMALDREAGLLVERAVVEYLLRDLGESIRAELSSFPDLHTPELAGARGDAAQLHQRLNDATTATLHRLAETLSRRAAALLPEIIEPTASESER